MKSVWTEGVSLPGFDKLIGEKRCEVAIIGGGMAGILTSYFLHKEGVDYVLLEKGKLASATTANTTAKITVQTGLVYDKILRKYGALKAQGYYLAGCRALEKYREIAEGADCDLETRDNLVYSLRDRKKLEREMRALEIIGAGAELEESLPLPFDTAGAVSFSRQAQFHPLKFVSGISKGLRAFENSHVTRIENGVIYTKEGKVFADKIIIATHFPFIDRRGLYFLKMYQHRSYVLGLRGTTGVDAMYVDESGDGLSFRSYGDILLLGGGGHRTGERGGGYDRLRDFAREYYPNASESYAFAAEDPITADSVSYIGPYYPGSDRLFVATGFNKWGMIGSMISAMLLTDYVTGRKNPYFEVFSPNRSILHPELVPHILKTVKNLLIPTAPRCSHLGCALKWNKYEHTWDCACHGSRFDGDGNVLDGPANKEIKP